MLFTEHVLPLAAAPPEALAGGFGAMAAILLVGGAIFLRAQRNRQQFALMQAALEKGITQFPGNPPFWLLSLRQGITILTLGIGLTIIGAGAWSVGHGVPAPTGDALTSVMHSPPPPQERQGPPEEEDGPGMRPPRGPLGGFFGGSQQGPPSAQRNPPPRPNPAVQAWDRAQAEQIIGQVALGCGIILTLLGGVRILFSRVERKYITADPTALQS